MASMPLASGCKKSRCMGERAGWRRRRLHCCHCSCCSRLRASYSAYTKTEYDKYQFCNTYCLIPGNRYPRRDVAAMRETTVAIKGIKDGLLVTISPAEEWGIILGDLAARIDQQAAFYAGARVTLDVG